MQFKKLTAVAAIAAAFLVLVPPAWASETDALLNKLVQKKILTPEEAQEVRDEMAAEAKPPADAREVEIKEVVKKMAGGSWLEKVKWGGDFRLRHETQLREPATDRNLERFRLRFGFTAKPWDPLEIGVRLASGASGNPLSTNQSFSGTFDKKAIFIDKAYAKYTPWLGGSGPLAGLSMVGGKMENPYNLIPENNVWDNDVTPEGAAFLWKGPSPLPFTQGFLPVTPFATAGAFQIAEQSADENDPAIFGFQTGFDIALPEGMEFSPSIAYYNMTGIQGLKTTNLGFASLPGGNSTVTEGAATKFFNDYDMLDVAGRLSLPDIFKQPVAFYGDWTQNRAAEDDNNAWTAGTEIGKVTEKFGSWKAFYFYKRMPTDAVFAGLTDSDFGAGGTNHKGHIMGFQLGLNKWASAGLKYFRTDEIEGSQNRNDTLYADLQLKY